MALNPMQRRARNAFLTGMLVTLVVMALIVILLFYKINELKEDKDKLLALQKKVWVAASTIRSGDEITPDSFVQETVQTTVDDSLIMGPNNITLVNDDGEEFVDEEGNPEMKYISKFDIAAGTIITEDMLAEIENELTADQRIQEYNTIILPSELRNGDYIDIRFQLPSGVNYVVLSKKKVLKCTATTIWLKLTEEEMLTLGNAIIDAWQAVGSKLYAITYVEAGTQEAATRTYMVNSSVFALISENPNVLSQAKSELLERYNSIGQTQRMSEINTAVNEDASVVASGIQTEISSLKTDREAFVSKLEGTGEIGSEATERIK